MNRKHVISGLFWLAISIFVALKAIDLGLGTFSAPGSGFVFFWSSMGLGLLSVILIIRSIWEKGEAIPLMDLWKGLRWRKAAVAVITLFVYALLLNTLGFILATFLLMIVLFRLGEYPYWAVIVSAFFTTMLSFVIFRYFLEVHFPRGILGW